MEHIRFAAKFTAFAIVCMLVGGYTFFVYTGDLPKPDLDALAHQIAPSLMDGGSVIAVVAVAVCFFLTAIAPLIYAARSGDLFTVIVSLVALVVCFVMLVYSRTVIDMVLAAIIYLVSALVSVAMYATARVTDAISKANRELQLRR